MPSSCAYEKTCLCFHLPMLHVMDGRALAYAFDRTNEDLPLCPAQMSMPESEYVAAVSDLSTALSAPHIRSVYEVRVFRCCCCCCCSCVGVVCVAAVPALSTVLSAPLHQPVFLVLLAYDCLVCAEAKKTYGLACRHSWAGVRRPAGNKAWTRAHAAGPVSFAGLGLRGQGCTTRCQQVPHRRLPNLRLQGPTVSGDARKLGGGLVHPKGEGSHLARIAVVTILALLCAPFFPLSPTCVTLISHLLSPSSVYPVNPSGIS
eukprot:1159279-Pelagomonas_calceolata.AAC.18